MNLIEMFLHIFNRSFSRGDALLWLKDVCDSAPVRAAIIECLDTSGRIIHSDAEQTPVFPLRYIFTRDGKIDRAFQEQATVESMVDVGTPIDPETGDDLEWTGEVVDMIPLPEEGD
jgi:hypothetical protein